jgi:succinyl-diaminopimelate desuccinylase
MLTNVFPMAGHSQSALTELLSEMIAYKTVNPPGREQALADYLCDRLETSSVDFDIEYQKVSSDRSNIIARTGDQVRGSLLLTGHMDVVSATRADWSDDPFSLRHENGRLIGRGTADMKGALAAKIVAAESFLREHENTGEVILAFVVDEERNNTGTRVLLENGIETDAAIIGEPTQLQVAIAEYGAVGYELTVSGKGGHSGRPDLAINAIDGLRRVLDRIETLGNGVQAKEHELFAPGPSISVTEIDGGTEPNVIPETATATLDWRTLPDSTRKPSEFDEQLATAIDGTTLRGTSVDVDFERKFFSTGSEISPDANIARTALAAAHETGIDADLVGFNAGSDARFFTQSGIPTILFGPGSVEDDAHSADESITVDALLDTAEAYHRILERFLTTD